jgi:integrase
VVRSGLIVAEQFVDGRAESVGDLGCLVQAEVVARLFDVSHVGAVEADPPREFLLVDAESLAVFLDVRGEGRRLIGELPARWRLFFEFLAHTGLRIGEASELRWGRDVILSDRPYVKLRWQFADGRVCEPKSRYGKRDIPLSPRLTQKLRAVQPTDAHGQLVFSSSRGTRLDRHNLMYKVLAPAARRAGVPWVTLHTFRHTLRRCCSRPSSTAAAARTAKQVQEWLGHHSPAYTLKEYVHLIDAGVGDAAFLDELFQ